MASKGTDMPKIYVPKGFKVRIDGEEHTFSPGNHEVAKNVAEHWFVKAHIGEPEPASEGERAADELLAELAKREKALTEREKTAEQRDADLAKREEEIAAREKAAADAGAVTKAATPAKK